MPDMSLRLGVIECAHNVLADRSIELVQAIDVGAAASILKPGLRDNHCNMATRSYSR